MGCYDLLPALDAEDLALQEGPDATADVLIRHPIELPVVTDMPGPHDFARLLMDQQQLQILGARLAEGAYVAVRRALAVGRRLYYSAAAPKRKSTPPYLTLGAPSNRALASDLRSPVKASSW